MLREYGGSVGKKLVLIRLRFILNVTEICIDKKTHENITWTVLYSVVKVEISEKVIFKVMYLSWC